MSASRFYRVSAADAGMRIDALLGERGLYASRSAAACAVEAGRVLVNGMTVSKKLAVSAGETTDRKSVV